MYLFTGEPDDSDPQYDGADCIAMLEDQGFRWRTRNCNHLYYYVCEIDHLA